MHGRQNIKNVWENSIKFSFVFLETKGLKLNKIKQAEMNQLNAPKLYTSLFTYTMAPTV
jgi:hypothetical protein